MSGDCMRAAQESTESDCHSDVRIGAQKFDRVVQSVLTKIRQISCMFSTRIFRSQLLRQTRFSGRLAVVFPCVLIADDVEQC